LSNTNIKEAYKTCFNKCNIAAPWHIVAADEKLV